jgi:hypothetical protein
LLPESGKVTSGRYVSDNPVDHLTDRRVELVPLRSCDWPQSSGAATGIPARGLLGSISVFWCAGQIRPVTTKTVTIMSSPTQPLWKWPQRTLRNQAGSTLVQHKCEDNQRNGANVHDTTP